MDYFNIQATSWQNFNGIVSEPSSSSAVEKRPIVEMVDADKTPLPERSPVEDRKQLKQVEDPVQNVPIQAQEDEGLTTRISENLEANKEANKVKDEVVKPKWNSLFARNRVAETGMNLSYFCLKLLMGKILVQLEKNEVETEAKK